jgi:hypothetical protein
MDESAAHRPRGLAEAICGDPKCAMSNALFQRTWFVFLTGMVLGCSVVIVWDYQAQRRPHSILTLNIGRTDQMRKHHASRGMPTAFSPLAKQRQKQQQQHQSQDDDEEFDYEEEATASPPPPPPPPPPPVHPPADPPGACFRRFPWIEPALDRFFERARASAALSLQTTEESLASLADEVWQEGYHPGVDACALLARDVLMSCADPHRCFSLLNDGWITKWQYLGPAGHDLVTLRYNESTGRYDMDADMHEPPNRSWKRECTLPILEEAVARHGAELAAALGRKTLKLVIETEDFGVTWMGKKSKLPAFAFVTEPGVIDIPIPDFTFGCYPETGYTNSSWGSIAELLRSKSGMMPWGRRHDVIFNRANWRVSA